ncbi:DUF4389 domain-containing protein [bacterium]|nr:DUF4389 domain-containing protein [bacterium]
MNQAELSYSTNEAPSRGLAALGIILLKGLLLFPHLIVVGVLGWLAGILAYIGFWVVAITGKMPEGIRSILAGYLGWSARTSMWLGGVTDVYPPFEMEPTGYPTSLSVPRNDEPSRGLAVAGIVMIVKGVMLIPHAIGLFFVGFAAIIAIWINYFIVAFTGTTSQGIERFWSGAIQWTMRVSAWFYGLTDEYPPFGIEIEPSA